MFRNILVPTDGSPLALRAIKRAVLLAKEQKARVTGFYVGGAWEPRVASDAMLSSFTSPAQHAALVKQAAGRCLAAVREAAAAAGVRCSCAYAEGNRPYEKIIQIARRKRCDLIVMASHGRRGISRLLLGSETAKVLAYSRIPVLVCR